MRIAVIQYCPEVGQVMENAEKMVRLLKEAADGGAELAIFPEAALTGYTTENVESLALFTVDIPVYTIRKESERLNIAVCFGYIEKNEEGIFLTQELYSQGKSAFYHKTHLGTKEQEVFQAGDTFPLFQLPRPGRDKIFNPETETEEDAPSICCAIQLCWESHIPEISAIQRKNGVELIMVPYACGMTGESSLDNWSVHLPARASDQGVFVATCNLVFCKDGEYSGGGSAIYDPKGKRLGAYSGTDDHVLICDIAGPLPRELPEGDMHSISYFERKRVELFR